MGDPRRLKKKYRKPIHPWQKNRMDEESILIKEYGLKNKRELWKMNSETRRFTESAKRLIKTETLQSERERDQLLEKLYDLRLTLERRVPLDLVFGLTIRDVLERTLQTIVYKKGLANTMKKARQFITHNHIMVNGAVINSPLHLVTRSEEDNIIINPRSALSDPEHPERVIKKNEKGEPKKENKK